MTKKGGVAPKAKSEPKAKQFEPEVVLEARLTVAQVQKQGVRLNVGKSAGPVFMAESSLNFNRVLIPPEYEPKDGREYSLVITRVK